MSKSMISQDMYVEEFGGHGGKDFHEEFINSIGLQTGKEVDALFLNGVRHGGVGGEKRKELVLGSDEYISQIIIRAGARIDFLEFTTNKGRTTSGGGTGGNYYELRNIRLVAIGGKSGARLDRIRVTYVEGYQPSTLHTKNARFVIGFNPPNTILKEYKERILHTVDSYERVTQSMVSQKYSASVEAEYYAKVSASTEIKFENSKMETIKRELSEQLKAGTYTEVTIEKGYIGVLVLNADIMQNDESYWMYPTSELSYAVLPLADWKTLLKSYDLTGNLYTQLPQLSEYKTEKNGYVYYE